MAKLSDEEKLVLIKSKIMNLQNRLDLLIEDELYEDACEVRDEINELKEILEYHKNPIK